MTFLTLRNDLDRLTPRTLPRKAEAKPKTIKLNVKPVKAAA